MGMMGLWRQVRMGLRTLLHRDESDREIADEVRHYLEEAEAELIAAGASPDEARRTVRLKYGDALTAREDVRSYGWESLVESFVADMRYALRRLRGSPVFTVTALTTLALGIGATTAVFSAVSPILLEPPPFPGANRLVTLDDWNAGGTAMDATLGTFGELKARTHSFTTMAAVDRWQPSLTGSGDPERLDGERVTGDYFRVFEAQPLVGRGFTAEDDRPGAPDVVILSDALAERRFGGARKVLGRSIDLDGDPYLVVGVMAPAFDNVLAPSARIWSPLRERATGDFNTRAWGHHYRVVARLAPGATIDEARQEILKIGHTPLAAFPRPSWADLGQGLLVRSLQSSVAGGVRTALLAIVGAVLLLLAIASVNVANLLIARAAQRRREIAMRVALGAGGGRLIRQLLTESVALALMGGTLGLGVAQVGMRALVAVSPPELPRVSAIHLDVRVFLFALALTTAVGLIVGLVPAMGAARTEVTGGLQRGSRGTTAGGGRARNVLVVAEVALALVLLVGSGLLLKSVRRLTSVPPGFDASHLITMQVVEAGHAFDSETARLQFWQQSLEAVRRVRGVESAAFTSQLPLSGEIDGYGYEWQGTPSKKAGEDGSALRFTVSPSYFATMHIPLVRGRLLDEKTDRPGAPKAVVINETLARRLFRDQDPVGRLVRFGPEVGSGAWDVVVGVVGDVKSYTLAVEAPGEFYVANGQWAWADNVETLVVRTSSTATALVPSLKRVVWSVSRDVPILRVETMNEYIEASAGQRRFALMAIEVFALAALLLAAVGLYGVISESVTERMREMGVRAALGASRGSIVDMVVRRGMLLTGIGAVIGVAGAAAASEALASMLFGVSHLDPLTYAGVVAVLGAVSLLACWMPAVRAARVDPVRTLRMD